MAAWRFSSATWWSWILLNSANSIWSGTADLWWPSILRIESNMQISSRVWSVLRPVTCLTQSCTISPDILVHRWAWLTKSSTNSMVPFIHSIFLISFFKFNFMSKATSARWQHWRWSRARSIIWRITAQDWTRSAMIS